MGIESSLARLRSLQRRGDVTAWIEIPNQPGSFQEIPQDLPAELTQALKARGITRLYSHQAEAYQAGQAGKNFVVVTPTASGKTLCYNLPVLRSLAENPETRALYLFPTKALAQDQLAELHGWIRAAGLDFGVETYDGDTPSDMRRKIREGARIILTNPDMLHTAVLPHHPKWASLFRNLRYIIVDELHTYRGVFGSHLCNVFRRLKRIAQFYGSSIQFFCASATIANPGELGRKLLEEDIETIQKNGAPRASKELLFYNPPLVNPELGLRRSAIGAARFITELFLKEKVQTLTFASSRVNVEVLLRYLQNSLNKIPGERPAVRGYRGGYLPKTRREIERQLRDGELLGVVSTNALELGIDIGSLEASVLAGYPGSIASTWQQIGRAGRRKGRSASVLVARNLPLDQFIINHPDYFLGRSPEHAFIHPDNLQILVNHIKCAAFELPFSETEKFGGEDLREILDFLQEQGMVCKSGDSWHWSSEAYPADSVSLRNIADENFVVLNTEDGNRAIAEVDFSSAPELIHDEAIYMCEGRQFHVDRLDYARRKAYVREVKADYYTEAITYSGLRILRSEAREKTRLTDSEHGEVHLVKKFPGYKKIRFYTTENLGYGKIALPVHELHSTSYWFSVPEDLLSSLALGRDEIVRGFLGIAYAMQYLATLLLMCDLSDLGRSVGDRSTEWFAQAGREGLGFYSAAGENETMTLATLPQFEPTVFLYDNVPGGIGFSEQLYGHHTRLIRETLDLVSKCGCKLGCPSCVGPVDEVGRSAKRSALVILRAIAHSDLPTRQISGG